MTEWGKSSVSQNEGHAFESHFGHGRRVPSVIRLLKVGLDAEKWMKSPSPTDFPALSRTEGK